jgi:hypothetical protein
MNTTKLALVAMILTLTACGANPSSEEQQCTPTSCSEAAINAPVPGTPDSEEPSLDPREPARDPASDIDAEADGDVQAEATSYRFPAFKSSWGISRAMFDKAEDYYVRNERSLANRRYVTIIDMKKHSSVKRWFLLDLKYGTVEKHLTTHGKNSDANNDGYADSFSNVSGSKKSSLGFYKTSTTYTGSNGYSMRLDGLSSTNSNARSRAIVVHPATYVNEATPRAGRSWGCPALDPKYAKSVIDRIKGGSLMLIDI